MNNDNKDNMLGNEKLSKLIMKMSVPAIMGMIVMSLYNFVDAIFVGMIGTRALGAATIGYPFFMLIISMGMMFGIGGASYLSRLLGEKDTDKAERVTSTVIFASIALGLVFSAIAAPLAGTLANLFGATANIQPLAKEYIMVLSLGAVFPIVSMTISNLLRAEGSAMPSMIGMAIGAFLNIALDPIFIFWLDMGIKGAAIATVIAQAVSAIVLIGYYVRKKTVVKIAINKITFSAQIYSEVLKIGLPVFLQQLLTSVAMAVLNNVAGAFGDVAVAAIGAINRLVMVGFAIVLGFGQGLQPIIGYNYGAKKFKRVKDSMYLTTLYTTVVCLIYTVISVFFPSGLAGIFSHDPEVVAIIAKGLQFMAISWPILGAFIVVTTLFQSLGKGLHAAILALTRQGVLLILFVSMLPKFMGLNGVLLSQPLANIATTVLGVILCIPIFKAFNADVSLDEASFDAEALPANE